MHRAPWQWSFILLAGIWGCSFWWVELALETFTPVQVAFGRLVSGAVALLCVARAVGIELPEQRSTWRHLAVVALLLNSVPFTLFAFGQTRVTSILAGIVNAATPLSTTLFALLVFREERPTRDRLVGVLVGFSGVLVVLGVWERLPSGEWVGIAACLGAVVCYGVAFPYARRHLSGAGAAPVSLAAGQVLLGAAFLVPLVAVQAVSADGALRAVDASAVGGVVALGVLGTGLAYVLNYVVLEAAGASVASTVTYVTPVFAVVVGMVFLGEPIAWNHLVGGVVVLTGVAVAQRRARLGSAARPA